MKAKYKLYDGYIYEGHTFVANKTDISNATEGQFVQGTALIPCDAQMDEKEEETHERKP